MSGLLFLKRCGMKRVFGPPKDRDAATMDGPRASSMQIALASLLRRSPTILPIPGTSSVAHLKETLAAARLALPDAAISELERSAS